MSGEPSSPGMDRNAAMARVGGDAALLREIAGLFLTESEKQIQEIRSAIATGDAHAVEQAAHSLRGAVANFGAAAAVAAAQRLEQLGSAGDLKDAAAALTALERTLTTLCAELRAL